jgi:(1->4)-alpha-D-glucan 1-alpha-D-glucosylmutase
MRIPLATYRLQFNRHFMLAQARDLLGYLKELGISDLYASPLFLAAPESSHGYDVCSFEQINPALGTREDLENIAAELRKSGMGILLDIVPNHMGSHPSNCWWKDVLRNGERSEFANYFDINWNSSIPGLRGKVLLPVLGDHYANVLEQGELQLSVHDDAVHLTYFDKAFPLSPESEKRFRLQNIRSPEIKPFLARLNGKAGDSASFNELHALIDMQHYRLAYWRVGPHEINYRRFFDVTALVSVRVEDEHVFKASHQFIFELLRSGAVAGLRVDHPDGLRDPQTYFERLQNSAGTKVYVVAEKILSDDERLPENWTVQGTTGYDFLNYLNGIFVQKENEPAFTQIYHEFIGTADSFETIVFRSKQQVLRQMFVSEIRSLTHQLKEISSRSRFGADLVEADLRAAIIDFIAGFPVYRNYVADRQQTVSVVESAYIEQALRAAKDKTQLQDKRSLDFLARILSLECFPDFGENLRAEAREFAIRFQQLSGPATAKGLEDTAFYRYTRFTSLNEVGGNPGTFGIGVEEFHEYNRHKSEKWPHSLLATATHDTKRGEDVRARLNVLSEMPAEWEQAVRRWGELNADHKPNGAPNKNDEYLLYQTLVGTWTSESDVSAYTKRIQEYMLKSIREAKTATSWTDPDKAYENGVSEFIGQTLGMKQFVTELARFCEPVAFFGMFNSLAQVVLKICSPGVPDFYQGTELWDLSLVDPDNRRPVDFIAREDLLERIRNSSPSQLLENWEDGAVKLFTTISALRARQQYREIFEGSYDPVLLSGEKKQHLIAFARTAESGTILVAVPRFLRTLTGGALSYPTPQLWGGTALAFTGQKRFRNLLTNEEHDSLHAANLFRTFPAALLLALD